VAFHTKTLPTPNLQHLPLIMVSSVGNRHLSAVNEHQAQWRDAKNLRVTTHVWHWTLGFWILNINCRTTSHYG